MRDENGQSVAGAVRAAAKPGSRHGQAPGPVPGAARADCLRSRRCGRDRHPACPAYPTDPAQSHLSHLIPVHPGESHLSRGIPSRTCRFLSHPEACGASLRSSLDGGRGRRSLALRDPAPRGRALVRCRSPAPDRGAVHGAQHGRQDRGMREEHQRSAFRKAGDGSHWRRGSRRWDAGRLPPLRSPVPCGGAVSHAMPRGQRAPGGNELFLLVAR